MARPALEVADIFRGHGAAWRNANRGHVSLDHLKVMSAIENCRTAALGGHMARFEEPAHTVNALNSPRHPPRPQCPSPAPPQWMPAPRAPLLPLPSLPVARTPP